MVRYRYDAWGNCTVTEDCSTCNIANINPFRYRGYYFDSEIGMYYLQSRYYDPTVGRFINADESAIIYVNNDRPTLQLWMYANNSPIVFLDTSGYLAILAIAGGVVITVQQVLTYFAVVAVAFFFLALIFDRNFRNSIVQTITNVWNYAIDTAGYLKNALHEVIAIAKKSRQHSGFEEHHIVARIDYRADASRKLLKNYSLTPYDACNVVTVSKTLHKHLHTSAYHYGVYLFLKNMEIKGKNHQDRKYHVLAGLLFIAVLITYASHAI